MVFDSPIHANEPNLSKVLGAGLPVVLVFWRSDCQPCDQLSAGLQRLARTYAGRALVVKINADEEHGLVQRYGIDRVPTTILFQQGRQEATLTGAVAEPALKSWTDYLVSGGARPPAASGPSVSFRAGPASGRDATRSTSQGTASPSAEPVVLSDASFDQTIRSSTLPILVDFWAPWCGPCKMIAPTVAELARDYAGRALVGKVNVDDNPQVAGRYGIMSIPTLLIFKNGQVVDQIVGAQPAQVLRQRLARQVG